MLCGWINSDILYTDIHRINLCDISHDNVIKWKIFPHYWPFVWGIHQSPVNYPHKGQWHGALMFSLICAWTNIQVNNWDAGDLRCHHAHYDVTVISHNIYLQRHVCCELPCVDPLKSGNAYLCYWAWSSLLHIMAFCLICAEPLAKPMLTHCQLDPKEQNSLKFEPKHRNFLSRKSFWKCRLNAWSLSVKYVVLWTLSQPMPTYYQLDLKEQNQWNLNKQKLILIKKVLLKMSSVQMVAIFFRPKSVFEACMSLKPQTSNVLFIADWNCHLPLFMVFYYWGLSCMDELNPGTRKHVWTVCGEENQ